MLCSTCENEKLKKLKKMKKKDLFKITKVKSYYISTYFIQNLDLYHTFGLAPSSNGFS
jgi:hypothetical protein